MLRFLAGVVSALLLVGAGFFVWKSWAQQSDPVPAPPPPAAEGGVFSSPYRPLPVEEPPAATPKSREEKRFARADKDEDGRITRGEMLEPRRKAFAKLDGNGDGRLSFEEWAVKTVDKFAAADLDKNGALTAKEFERTKPKTRPKPKCRC